MDRIVKLGSPEFFKNVNAVSLENFKGETTDLTGVDVKALPTVRYDTVDFSAAARGEIKTMSREELMSVSKSTDNVSDVVMDESFYTKLPDDFDVKHRVSGMFASYGTQFYGVGYEYEDEKPSIQRSLGIGELFKAVRENAFDEDSIVTVAAKVGREIDDAYKHGCMSDELYARFNDEIKSAANAWTDKLYDRRAAVEITDERREDYLNHRLTPMTPKDLEQYTTQRKQRLIKKDGFDFTEFFKRIVAARYGGEEKTFECFSGGKQWT